MKRVLILLLLVVMSAAPVPLSGQIGLDYAGGNLGAISRLGYGDNRSGPVLYPELQVGGGLIHPSIEWSAHWGYWDDAIGEITVSDGAPFSASGHVLGVRMAFLPANLFTEWLLPVAVTVGYSAHLMRVTERGGDGRWQSPGRSASTGTLEAGMRVYSHVTESLEVRVQGFQLFGLGNSGLASAESDRYAVTVGLAYHVPE